MRSLKTSNDRMPQKRGGMLIELCISLALFMLFFSAFSEYASYLSVQTNEVMLTRQAMFISEVNLENVLYALEKNFFEISTSTLLHNLESSQLKFSQDVSLADLTPCRKSIMSNVSWDQRNFFLVALSADPAESHDRGGDCEGTVSPDWTPSTHPSYQPFEASILDSDVFGGYTFIAATSSVASSRLYIKNSNDSNIFSHIDIDRVISALDAVKNNVFLATDGTSSQVEIISAENIYGPSVVSKVSLPGVAGSFPGAISIFYYDHKIYVGTHRTAGHEFHIFDVADPEHPVWLGSVELNHNINKIIVRGHFAYLATSGNTKNLIILDISDPANIKQVSFLAFFGQ